MCVCVNYDGLNYIHYKDLKFENHEIYRDFMVKAVFHLKDLYIDPLFFYLYFNVPTYTRNRKSNINLTYLLPKKYLGYKGGMKYSVTFRDGDIMKWYV